LAKGIDYSGLYPTMHSPLPRHAVKRYRELMFSLGFYPLTGKVRGFSTAEHADNLSEREWLDREIAKQYYADLAKRLGSTPERIEQLATPGPATANFTDGSRPSRNDPQRAGFLLGHLAQRLGWETPLEIADVKKHWDEYVGSQVASHSTVESFEKGKLIVRTDSTAWATQLKFLLPELLKQLNKRLGAGVVQQVIIRCPQVPSWNHGPRSVPGRGPRDTYG
jgi:hypothetical protein